MSQLTFIIENTTIFQSQYSFFALAQFLKIMRNFQALKVLCEPSVSTQANENKVIPYFRSNYLLVTVYPCLLALVVASLQAPFPSSSRV